MQLIFFSEWNNKAAGFVSYDSAGRVRVVEQLRQVMAELNLANTMLDEVIAWCNALWTLRAKKISVNKE